MSQRHLRLTRWVRHLAPLALLGFVGATACDEGEVGPVEVVDKEGPKSGKSDQWSAADNPSIFTPDLKLAVKDLPLEGAALNTPWASSYWPVYQNSIAYRWAGPTSDSPAAKYGKAFNVTDVEKKVSDNNGIDKYKSSRKACKLASECDATIGEDCAKHPGAESGVCIPTWWGICHAWGPASILEPEAMRDVTRNGVTFKVNDIKALMTIAYDRSTSKFVSLRCDKDQQTDKIKYDAYGRPVSADAACKDTNPGTYHVLLTNYLGLRGQAFVEDRTFDDEVWNQPLRSYKITQQKEVTAQEANKLIGVTAAAADLDIKTFGGAALAASAWLHQPAYPVLAGTVVKIVMTGDHDVDLYAKVGAQPTDAAYDCRPYTEGSAESCDITIPAGQTQLFVSALAYSGPAKFNVTVTIPKTATGIPTKYLFNDNATKFYDVKLEVQYIGESDSATDGNLASTIEQYTRTDHYEYILEVDKDGKVNGGEWVGPSKTAHPDFLWLPTGRQTDTVAGGAISYANVKSLLDESVAPPGGGTTPAANAVKVVETVAVAANEWKFFGPYADVGADFSAVLSGTGDADLYVKKGAKPTEAAYDCRPYKGTSEETCTGAGAGSFFVAIHGYKASQVTLTIRYTKTGGTPVTPVTPVAHLNISGNVAVGAILSYSLNVKAGKAVVVRTTAAKDIDLYVRMTLPPTTAVYDQRGYTNSGNETVTVVPSQDGVLHIAVHGYQASAFTLKTADQ